jgi:hypothetical protein
MQLAIQLASQFPHQIGLQGNSTYLDDVEYVRWSVGFHKNMSKNSTFHVFWSMSPASLEGLSAISRLIPGSHLKDADG